MDKLETRVKRDDIDSEDSIDLTGMKSDHERPNFNKVYLYYILYLLTKFLVKNFF